MEYYVLTENGKTAPKHVHRNRTSAEIEARRLSEQFNTKATVLLAVAVFEQKPVTRTEVTVLFDNEDELPF